MARQPSNEDTGTWASETFAKMNRLDFDVKLEDGFKDFGLNNDPQNPERRTTPEGVTYIICKPMGAFFRSDRDPFSTMDGN